MGSSVFPKHPWAPGSSNMPSLGLVSKPNVLAFYVRRLEL